jgi:hypothetical protein
VQRPRCLLAFRKHYPETEIQTMAVFVQSAAGYQWLPSKPMRSYRIGFLTITVSSPIICRYRQLSAIVSRYRIQSNLLQHRCTEGTQAGVAGVVLNRMGQ